MRDPLRLGPRTGLSRGLSGCAGRRSGARAGCAAAAPGRPGPARGQIVGQIAQGPPSERAPSLRHVTAVARINSSRSVLARRDGSHPPRVQGGQADLVEPPDHSRAVPSLAATGGRPLTPRSDWPTPEVDPAPPCPIPVPSTSPSRPTGAHIAMPREHVGNLKADIRRPHPITSDLHRLGRRINRRHRVSQPRQLLRPQASPTRDLQHASGRPHLRDQSSDTRTSRGNIAVRRHVILARPATVVINLISQNIVGHPGIIT